MNVKWKRFFKILDDNNKGMHSVSIFKDGQEVYSKSNGFADIENNVLANHDTKYRIGSISKTFTAVLVLQLVEEGRLSLKQKLSDFFPDFENAERITIEQLLRHRSGIYNFTNDPEYFDYNTEAMSRKKLLKKIISYEAAFKPGDRTEYSNSNYVLLSMIVEDITGEEFKKLIEKRITKPLSLEDTYFGGGIGSKDNEAFSYNFTGRWVKYSETDMSIPLGAGSIVSTPANLNAFLHALFNGKLLNEDSMGVMTTLKDNFGLGMFRVPFYSREALGHTGGIDAFNSSAFYFTAENVSIAIISNGTIMPVNDIVVGALSIYFGRDYELPSFESVELTEEQLDLYSGTYTSPTFPMDIKIWREEKTLMAQATGQAAFPLESKGNHVFNFDAAGIVIEFNPDKNTLVLKQGGGVFELTR
jgi:CubicO group peptidase (beta-lactamase class C family)